MSRVHPFSTASSVDVFFSIVYSVDFQGVSINIASSVYALPSYDAFKFQNPRLYGIRQYGTRMNKIPMPGAVRYRYKGTKAVSETTNR